MGKELINVQTQIGAYRVDFFIEINSRPRTFKIGTAEWFENSKYVSACKNDIPILKHLKGLLSRPKAEL